MPIKKPKILETHPHLKDFVEFLDHLRQESERGQVLISASVLDDLLVKALQAFLIEGHSAEKLLNAFNAPLGTFSARIEATHAMGIISDEERHDATVIRKIRNEFAHTLAISFADQRIKDLCASLHFRAKGDVKILARHQFSSAVSALILNLTNRPHYVAQKRLAWSPWPF